MAAYKILTVGEKEYKLKLNTNATILIEDKLGGNILDGILVLQNVAGKSIDGKGNIKAENMSKMPIPSLKYCVTIIWGSLQKYHHGITFPKACDLVDEYMEDGKTRLDLFNEVMSLLMESGTLANPEENDENLK